MKIWDTHKTLLREVDLGSSLGAAVFLNNFGDILLSFQSQLYCMESSKFYPLSAAFCKQTHEEEIASLGRHYSNYDVYEETTYMYICHIIGLCLIESAVFEDPSLKYDFVTNELTTDMETYLVNCMNFCACTESVKVEVNSMITVVMSCMHMWVILWYNVGYCCRFRIVCL